MLQSARRHGPRVVLEIAINIALPYAIYVESKPALGDVNALLASMAPPLLWSVVEFARRRRIDIVAIFSIAGIALSLLAFVGGGSVKLLQLRENLVSAIFAFAFLVSAAIGKPLIWELALASMRRGSAEKAAEFEALRDRPYVRQTMMVLTLVWGFGLLAQTAVACALVFAVSIPTYLLVSPIVGYGGMGALALWTVWYSRMRRREGTRLRAAADAAALQLSASSEA